MAKKWFHKSSNTKSNRESVDKTSSTEKKTKDNECVTLKQVIEAGAISRLQSTEVLRQGEWETVSVTPVLTGWAGCVFALEGNGSDLVREILEKESFEGDNTVESINLRKERLNKESKQKGQGQEPSIEETKSEIAPRESYASMARKERPVELKFPEPYTLVLSLSSDQLKDCYTVYTKSTPEGNPQYFRILSGPLFILTRISLAMSAPLERKTVWKQLLVYLSSVNSLPKGEFRNSFHLVDHEKWLELVLSNLESTIIGISAHDKMARWLRVPLRYVPSRAQDKNFRKKLTYQTTHQVFEEIAKSWEGSGTSREEVYQKLVQLRQDLGNELEFIHSLLQQKPMEIAKSSNSQPGTVKSRNNNSLSHRDPQSSSPYFPRNRRSFEGSSSLSSF
ncbi:hypothetical protein JCM5350_005705 [Sporobolomyces pararoseus]